MKPLNEPTKAGEEIISQYSKGLVFNTISAKVENHMSANPIDVHRIGLKDIV